MSEKRGLGRGLSALMADVQLDPGPPAAGEVERADMRLPIERLAPNPDQPRRNFSDTALEELTESIRAKGVLQPLIVRPSPTSEGDYEIVAGERRWRAAQRAQLHQIPVLIRDLTDTEMLEVAIIENIQRADLNPVEEAVGYRNLLERFGHTQEQLAAALGKSRSHISNLLRLLHLPDDVIDLLRDGKLSSGHARALITCENPAEVAQRVVARGLSVRETEKLTKRSAPGQNRTKPRKTAAKDPDTRALEQDLSAHLGMAVDIAHVPDTGAGVVTIRYTSLEDLDKLCQVLSTPR